MKKLKKFIRQPNIFLRDYFNKRYPDKSIEQPFFEYEENLIIEHEKLLNGIERSNNALVPLKIDVVFTWVDNQDTEWQEKRQKHQGEITGNVSPLAIDNARFENRNELFFSVNSVLNNLPWVNHIYIVTDSQTPIWFQDHKKITIIDHKQIIDEKYLPTFNSHVIEAHLHNIPNLCENFIYFNDDVFVARPLQPEHFFHHNNIASIYLADKSLAAMRQKGKITPTLLAAERCVDLLNKAYGKKVDAPLVHSYIPLKKSAYRKAWALFGDEVNAFLSNKFRGENDLNLATFLVPWVMYFEGKSTPNFEICYYFNIRSNQAKTYYQKLLYKKQVGHPPHSFCANDFNSNKDAVGYEEHFIKFLQAYFKEDLL